MGLLRTLRWSRTPSHLLVVALAHTGTDGPIQQGAGRQAHEDHQPTDREPQSGLLARRLRIRGLVFRSVGQGPGRPVGRASATRPVPRRSPAPGLARQGRDHRQRQPGTGLAEGAGTGAEAR